MDWSPNVPRVREMLKMAPMAPSAIIRFMAQILGLTRIAAAESGAVPSTCRMRTLRFISGCTVVLLSVSAFIMTAGPTSAQVLGGPSSGREALGPVFFLAGDLKHGSELWVTDGTPEGSLLVKDIYPGVGGLIGKEYHYYGSAPAQLVLSGAP